MNARSPNQTESVPLSSLLSRVGDLGFKRRVETLLAWLDVHPGDRILDCGCGEGFYTMVLSELYENIRVTAFDQNAELLSSAATWVKKKNQIVFQNGDIERGLPFKESSFEKIIFTEVLEHLEDDKKAMGEIYRVLKPGGIVGLTIPNARYPFFWDPLNWVRQHLRLGHFNPKNTILGGVWSYDHKRLYTQEGIKRLVEESGFSVVEIVPITHYCLPFNYLILRIGKMASSFLVPSQVRRAMEKFEWKESGEQEKGFLSQMMNAAFSLFRWVDRFNDGIARADISSVSIGLRLKKNPNNN